MVNMSDVWDRTTAFLTDQARALWPIAVVALLIPHAIRALVSGAADQVNPLVASVIGLVCVLIALWGQLAVTALALDPGRGRHHAAAAATRGYGKALAAMVLVFGVLLVLALPIGGVLAANGADLSMIRDRDAMTQANLSAASAAFVSIYAMILAVLAFVAAIRLAVLYPVVIAEGGIAAAIRRSLALTRRIVWKMIGVWLLFALVYIIAWLAATSALGTVVGLLSSSHNPFSIGRIFVAIIGGAVSMMLAVVVAVFAAKLYLAVTAARESVTAA